MACRPFSPCRPPLSSPSLAALIRSAATWLPPTPSPRCLIIIIKIMLTDNNNQTSKYEMVFEDEREREREDIQLN
jgi:hypothetical protein